MDYLKSKVNSTVKAFKHWVNPNQNPTEDDKKAFDLLNKGQVDMFIDLAQSGKINLHVVDFNTVSFLIKAQDVANDNNQYKKLLGEKQCLARAIKVTAYLLERGVNINYTDKSGSTALYSSVHWQNYQLVELLLKWGADPNLGAFVHFQNNPLLSAVFKQNLDMIILLISYGADVEYALKLSGNQQKSFPISQQMKVQIQRASNLQAMIRQRRYDQALGKQTVLSMMSEAQFTEMCYYV